MSKLATFSNPVKNYNGAGGAETTVPVARLEIHQSFGEISGVTLRVETDAANVYNLDSTDTNALQLHSQVVVKDGADFWFRGVVAAKPYYEVSQAADGSPARHIVVECDGNEQGLTRAAVTDSAGNVRWSVATSTVLVGESAPSYLPLQSSGEFGSFDVDTDTLWPDPADAEGAKCYVQDGDSASDTIHAEILIGTAAPFDVEFTTTNQGFPPQGWLKIGTEWMYYEGYDPTGGSDRYKVNVKERAALGTTAAGHAANATVTSKVGKRLGPEPAIVYEDPAGGTAYISMRYGERWTAHYSYGCFVMAGGVEAGATYATTCYYYDADKVLDAGSTVYSLPDIIRLIVTTPLAYGGSGFVLADLGDEFDYVSPSAEYTAMALVTRITRYDYNPQRNPKTQWLAAQGLITSLGLTDEYEFVYNHSEGKLRLLEIANGVVDQTITGVDRLEQETSIADVYSAVRVEYTHDQDPNLASHTFAWHEGAAAAGAKPDTWYYCTEGAEGYGKGTNTTSTAAGASAFGAAATTDGKLDSKLLAEVFHDPAADFPHTMYWFGAGSPSVDLDEIVLRVNAYRSTEDRTRHNTDETYVLRIDGCTDFNDATHTGTWQNLGTKLQGTAKGNIGRTAKTVELNLKQFALPQVNAVRVVWEYMAGPVDDGHSYWAAIHNIRIMGNITKYALVQTTDDVLNKTLPQYLYDVNAHVKLRGGVNADGSAGAQRVHNINIGAASEAAALTIGRAYLESSLILYKQHSYSYPGVLASKPELGDTIATDEDGGGVDYTGVMREFTISVDGEATTIDYTVLNYAASNIS